MKFHSSRRQFLQSACLTAGTLCLTGWRSRPSPRPRSANDRLNVAVVGVAEYGRSHLEECIPENVVALCDVDTLALDAASRQFPKAAVYADFRRMIDREPLDAVIIATPDHSHAIVAAWSLQAGLHVFCADPLSHTVSEARMLAQLARRRKRVTQLGGSVNSPATEDRVLEVLRSGELGPVTSVHAWTHRSHGELLRSAEQPPVPRHLDYDLWLGPQYPVPYCADYLPGRWRHWWTFGGGTLAEAGSPYFALIHRGLGLEAPARVEATGAALHLKHPPSWLRSRWTYELKEPLPPVQVTWHHGTARPEHFTDPRIAGASEGLVFSGSAGDLFVNPGAAWLLLTGQPARNLSAEVSPGNRRSRLCEWLDACRSLSQTSGHFEFAAPMTEALLLGNVAYRTDRKLVWNARKMVASNLPEASEYVQHSYRPGWWV
ncbi:MAG: Gfo/Idh/MocA family oxidoreductase [Verrucomicrobiales bacterium]|nr:Gfo/Idh/MocA family oxidoreductase [Verrucomicrobiales bacterium]